MKTTKKIFAALLAVMMIFMMIPFSVSAAEGKVSFNLTCDQKGYEFSVYQVATLDKVAGKYTTVVDVAGVDDDIQTVGDNTQAIVKKLDEAKTGLGTAVATFDTNKATSATVSVVPGIYYVKATIVPAGIKSSQSSLVVLPRYTTNGWVDYLDDETKTSVINLGGKYSSSDAVSDKNILLEDGSLVDASTTGYGDEVTFRLNATVMGSAEKNLKEYALVDNMSDALDFGKITAVYLADANGGKISDITDYECVEDAIVDGELYTFAVVLGDTILADDNFYKAAQVVVEYTATINDKAAVNTAIPNSSKLVYQNSEGVWSNTIDVTVNVFTAGLSIFKTDAKTGNGLAGAEFGVYTDAACTGTPIAKALSLADGTGLFVKVDANGNRTTDIYKFASGTYYVKEISAPAGYILSTEVTKVVMETSVSANNTVEISFADSDSNVGNAVNGVLTVSAQNSPIKLPQTGGMGTMMFTIGGAALIACAGLLLFVLKRKAQ